FASKNSVAASAVDGLCQGLGYTVVLIIMCVVREFLGNGTFGGGLLGAEGAGIRILPEQFPAMMMILPVGGFLTLGVLIAVVQYFLAKREKGADDK
ncbi:MAG: Rnf-Nqr domain containing protein, partial [Candidatus Limivicinus sp.]